MRHVSLNLLVIIILLNEGCQNAQIDCQDFKTGEFTNKPDNSSGVKIIRSANEQIESNDEENYRDVFEVEWISECEYILIFKETSDPKLNHLTNKDTIRIQITEIDGNSYKYKGLINRNEFSGEEIKNR
jgi:hypothetical protein